ncbi:hypothetical protein NX059_007599 [Plenodomus lindquistii]|nr:hypothetical protein NX059_007599 [Plenodomus lindquistii]
MNDAEKEDSNLAQKAFFTDKLVRLQWDVSELDQYSSTNTKPKFERRLAIIENCLECLTERCMSWEEVTCMKQ